jgi:hypothetical protein
VRITPKWHENEDGKLRYLVGSKVKDFRAEVLTPYEEKVPTLTACLTKSPSPDRSRSTPPGDVVGGRLSSVTIAADLASIRIHSTCWVNVLCDGVAGSVPLLVIPAWEAMLASGVTSLAILIVMWWALDTYAGFPHGHWLETVARMSGLPVTAVIVTRFTGLFGSNGGNPPFWGLLHRIDRALPLAAAVVALMLVGNHLLATVHNGGETTLTMPFGPLAPQDRAVIPYSVIEGHENTPEYSIGPGDQSGAWTDRLLAFFEPTALTASPVSSKFKASAVVDGCPAAKNGVCELVGAPDAHFRIYGDAVDGPQPGSRENGQPVADLLVNVPWRNRPEWTAYLRARLTDSSGSRASIRAFFRIQQEGPELLELSLPPGGQRSPLAVTPFFVDHHEIKATMDEDLAAPPGVKTPEDAKIVEGQRGGILECDGLDADLAEIVVIVGLDGGSKKLEVTAKRPGGSEWHSRFSPHGTDAGRVWSCALPADQQGPATYRFAPGSADVVRPMPSPQGFRFEIEGTGTGTCSVSGGVELRRFAIERSDGELLLYDPHHALESSFRPSEAPANHTAWLCVHTGSNGSLGDLTAWTRSTAVEHAHETASLPISGDTIAFPATFNPVVW